MRARLVHISGARTSGLEEMIHHANPPGSEASSRNQALPIVSMRTVVQATGTHIKLVFYPLSCEHVCHRRWRCISSKHVCTQPSAPSAEMDFSLITGLVRPASDCKPRAVSSCVNLATYVSLRGREIPWGEAHKVERHSVLWASYRVPLTACPPG